MIQQLMWKFLHCKGEAATEAIKTTGNDTNTVLCILIWVNSKSKKTYKLSPTTYSTSKKKQRQQVEDSNLQASKVHQQLCGSVQEQEKLEQNVGKATN